MTDVRPLQVTVVVRKRYKLDTVCRRESRILIIR